MGLGVNPNGNNWKYALANFAVILGTQILFNLNDLMATPDVFPTPWWICKTMLTSAVATFIFAGYNKLTAKKET